MVSLTTMRGHRLAALPQSVGASLRRYADMTGQCLTSLLSMNISLRTQALQVRGADVALDPVVSLLEIRLAEVRASASWQEPAREEAASGLE
eukprot:15456777-Alexandrium_andersonii.AAC.1